MTATNGQRAVLIASIVVILAPAEARNEDSACSVISTGASVPDIQTVIVQHFAHMNLGFHIPHGVSLERGFDFPE